ncbi:MAG: hypothetical protein UT50_C0005G0006 [Candidatus Moranbacteria bacterium GW2011_GWA2_39_41]|nr:MAG: hypothetical protein UT50_C0005G0006 [Candidatus Moranbacteria bacterium GW2011_GWA2_39_41]
MTKKLIGGIILFAVLVTGLWFWSSREDAKKALETPVTTDIVLFFGAECPHCKDVDKFVVDNQIAEKVKFDSLEVWHNDANAKVLIQKSKECGIDENKVGVPFLFARGKCFVGTPEVEGFFKQEVEKN